MPKILKYLYILFYLLTLIKAMGTGEQYKFNIKLE